jgi:quinolinate synthase
MKMNTLEKLRDCLLQEIPEIQVKEETRVKAAMSLDRMLRFS